MRDKPDVTVTSVVAVAPADAFRIFTEDIDLWWHRGPRHRFTSKRDGVLRFDPGPGGRLVEVYDEANGDLWEVGRVLAWEPGARLVFEWRLSNFAAGETTEVEVRFEPVDQGTRVVVEHRGMSALPKAHPARHGQENAAFTRRIGTWWGELILSMRAHAQRPLDRP